MQRRHAFAFAFASLVLLASGTAAAQTRTWVSGVGDDVNPCSRTAPCKTFAGAISKTAAGGEINALDSAGYGAVTITKAMTIRADGVTGGILAAGTNGIVVSAGPGDTVVLRGLDIEGAGTGLNGIRFLTGGALHVENCTIHDFTQAGIQFTPSSASRLSVIDTIVRRISPAAGASYAGILISPSAGGSAEATLEGVQLLENFHGLRAQGAVRVSARQCVAAGNTSTGFLAGFSAKLALDGCKASSNGKGIRADGAGAIVRLANSLVVDNGADGLATASGGLIQSFGNNRIAGNGTNGAPSSTIPEQ